MRPIDFLHEMRPGQTATLTNDYLSELNITRTSNLGWTILHAPSNLGEFNDHAAANILASYGWTDIPTWRLPDLFVIIYHNEHQFDNASQEEIRGPYNDMETAKAALAKIVTDFGDAHFKIDPIKGTTYNGTYAGYDVDELIANKRHEDLASEVWAEIVPLRRV